MQASTGGLPPEISSRSPPTSQTNNTMTDPPSNFPPLPKNSKRKTMHISEFLVTDKPAAGTEDVPSNGAQGLPYTTAERRISYKDMAQGLSFSTGDEDIYDLEDLAIDSDNDDITETEEDDEFCPTIRLNKDEKASLRKPWRHALIIKMYDKQIGYLSLMRKLQAKWAIKGKLTLTDLGCSFYVARFSSRQDHEHVITQGPWMIDDHYLTIRKWVPNFVPTEDKLTHLTAWVRIPKLPVEYFDKGFLTKIGSRIGTVIRIDKNTEMAERGQFTRMSIEVNLEKPLLSKFRLNKKVYHIQYEGLRMICFKCGRLGHLVSECSFDPSKLSPNTHDPQNEQDTDTILMEPVTENVPVPVPQEPESNFGEWMFVKKPPRRKPQPKNDYLTPATGNQQGSNIFNYGKNQSNNYGTRFQILANQSQNNLGIISPHILPGISQENITFSSSANQPNTSHNNSSNISSFQKYSNDKNTKYSKKKSTSNSTNIPKSSNIESSNILKDITNSNTPIQINSNTPAAKNLSNSQTSPIIQNATHPRPTHLHISPTVATTSLPPSAPNNRDDSPSTNLQDESMVGDARTLYGGDDTGEPSNGCHVSTAQRTANESPSGAIDSMEFEVSRRGEEPWFFSAIYASPNPQNRNELWAELERYAKNNNYPWMLAGDFNETRSLAERHGGDHNMARRCNLFNNWIENCELIELEFSGSLHTWARGNSCDTRQSARLDRALCNSDWGTRFENATVKHFPAYQSDHCPLFISPNGFVPLQSVQKPFRFQAAWLTHEKFAEFVSESWSVGSSLVDQLSSLSHKLQNWNHEVFGNIFRKKRELLACIEGCQKHLSLKKDRYLMKLEAKLRREL
ncbi:uncharacterized protein LOC141614592 [Silene latifolia]|uniref:uncharacterized protein LOC141614592 n=1 Tax=Silene latifolia TaxID=37657 RepID=UPI003D77DEC1